MCIRDRLKPRPFKAIWTSIARCGHFGFRIEFVRVRCGRVEVSMIGMKRVLMWLPVVLLMLPRIAGGQVATTTVQDTIYSANGTPASGTVLVSWNAFTTAGGESVPAGTTSATIGAGGVLTMALTPNAGSKMCIRDRSKSMRWV